MKWIQVAVMILVVIVAFSVGAIIGAPIRAKAAPANCEELLQKAVSSLEQGRAGGNKIMQNIGKTLYSGNDIVSQIFGPQLDLNNPAHVTMAGGWSI